MKFYPYEKRGVKGGGDNVLGMLKGVRGCTKGFEVVLTWELEV